MFKYKNSSNSFSDITKKISEFDILAHYLNITTLPTLINSPLRNDKHASFGLCSPDGKKIYYKDFATGESGNLYSLLQKLWNVSFQEVINRIEREVTTHSCSIIKPTCTHKVYKSDVDIKVKVRNWQPYDLLYWKSYGISLKWLVFGDVYPISHILVTKNSQTQIIPAEKYAYVYVERKDNNITLKIYQPYSQTYKWTNKNDASVWDLWTKLPPTGDKLIITSSRKDALTLYANTGIPAVSLQGEGYLPKEKVINELKERFTNIFVLFDNDFQSEINHGRIFGQRLCEKFGLHQIEIPTQYQSKDPSDLVLHYGVETLKKVITNLTTFTDDLR